MPAEFDVPTQDAAIAAILITLGEDAFVRVFTGSRPAACIDADTGVKLAEFTLADVWFSAPVTGGQGSQSGVFNTDALAPGVPQYIRYYSSNGTCRIQMPVYVAPTPIPLDGGAQVSHSPWVEDEPVRIASALFKARITP